MIFDHDEQINESVSTVMRMLKERDCCLFSPSVISHTSVVQDEQSN